jgi:hypothetical protein
MASLADEINTRPRLWRLFKRVALVFCVPLLGIALVATVITVLATLPVIAQLAFTLLLGVFLGISPTRSLVLFHLDLVAKNVDRLNKTAVIIALPLTAISAMILSVYITIEPTVPGVGITVFYKNHELMLFAASLVLGTSFFPLLCEVGFGLNRVGHFLARGSKNQGTQRYKGRHGH